MSGAGHRKHREMDALGEEGSRELSLELWAKQRVFCREKLVQISSPSIETDQLGGLLTEPRHAHRPGLCSRNSCGSGHAVRLLPVGDLGKLLSFSKSASVPPCKMRLTIGSSECGVLIIRGFLVVLSLKSLGRRE